LRTFPQGDSRRNLPDLRTRQSGNREIDHLTFDWAAAHRPALTSVSTGPGKGPVEGWQIVTEALPVLSLTAEIKRSSIPPTVV
jgi:hypothetical protein